MEELILNGWGAGKEAAWGGGGGGGTNNKSRSALVVATASPRPYPNKGLVHTVFAMRYLSHAHPLTNH